MAIGTAAAIGLAAAGAGSFLGGRAKSKAAGKAADAVIQATEANNALAGEFLMPYSERGNLAGDAYNALLGLGGDTEATNAAFQNYLDSSGYNFMLAKGS